jgi:hypothetical protein
MIFARGYYTRTVVWAADYRNGSLTTRWILDSNSSGAAVPRSGQPPAVHRGR